MPDPLTYGGIPCDPKPANTYPGDTIEVKTIDEYKEILRTRGWDEARIEAFINEQLERVKRGRKDA